VHRVGHLPRAPVFSPYSSTADNAKETGLQQPMNTNAKQLQTVVTVNAVVTHTLQWQTIGDHNGRFPCLRNDRIRRTVCHHLTT